MLSSMFVRLFSLFLLAATAVVMGGCASTDSDTRSEDRVSNIPWNRPEQWEGQGPMGGMMNTR